MGQKQRFALARAFARRSDFLLLDEPTSALDNIQTNRFLRQTIRSAVDGVSILLVTHDLGVAELLLKKIRGASFLFIADGMVKAEGGLDEYLSPSSESLANFLARDFTDE